jgi:hypothetical protein
MKVTKILSLLLLSARVTAAWQLPGFMTESSLSGTEDDRDLVGGEQEGTVVEAGDPNVDWGAWDVSTDEPAVVGTDKVVVTQEPSEAPTESPAPSPSPSETPTIKPTISPAPTPSPSEAPTESPAPSPSPSETPTLEPTDPPTFAPTNAPTVSSQPSATPSAEPSDKPSVQPSVSPSAHPTVSVMPSAAPSVSMMPSASPSWSPSASPTHVMEVSGTFEVTLPAMDFMLKPEHVAAFEEGTAAWLESRSVVEGGQDLVNDGGLTSVVVNVDSQDMVDMTDETGVSLSEALHLVFTITAMYKGSNHDFDLEETLTDYFTSLDPLWIRSLFSQDEVFSPLMPELELGQETKKGSGQGGLSAAGAAGVSLVVIGAVFLAVGASIYSIRAHRMATYGEELQSPREDDDSSGGRRRHPGLWNAMSDDSMDGREDDYEATEDHLRMVETEESTTIEKTSTIIKNPDAYNHVKSPSSLEKGSSGFPILRKHPRDVPKTTTVENLRIAAGVQRGSGGGRAKDPPSAESEVGAGVRTDAPPASKHINSLFDNTTEMSEYTKEDKFPESSYYGENREIILTQSVGGTLGAASVNEKYESESGFSMSDFSIPTFGRPKDNKMGKSGKYGSRKMIPEEELQQTSSYDSISRRAGLYDVFAPAGPIGIVVDTTKHGPAVHSLKPTSPMLGLINPGDLIVGLDDEDTRGMTAATLTRLMAQKSNQKERKITLLAAENL